MKPDEKTSDLLRQMLEEDIGDGDVTSALFDSSASLQAVFRARCEGVMAGGVFITKLFSLHDETVQTRTLVSEGDSFGPGDNLIHVNGPARSVLEVERTALNLLCRLCGIATKTKRMVKIVAGHCDVLDTRKTTPLLRPFEKYAVKLGGGVNHRMGLYDQVLVKDNHLSLFAGGREDFERIVREARKKFSKRMVVEIEVDDLDQFKRALDAEPDILLLDNMSPQLMSKCVSFRDERVSAGGKRVLLEASGGINEKTIDEVAASGVDRISMGALTYAPVIVDIGLDAVEESDR
ncbi:MAG: carboxylating nicotinate-nucleotide diphosphorylase [Planctomycetota bacterium]|nr:carboxylating nicotinate-nucleotide diphosphorylase [Planctomycetota bacterium]